MLVNITAINSVTTVTVSVTFCDKIQFILEAREELVSHGLVKHDWNSKVTNAIKISDLYC
jgi:hypothetical protein